MLNTFLSDEHKRVEIAFFENFGLCQFLLILRFFAHNFFVAQYFQNRTSPSEREGNLLQLLYQVKLWETFMGGCKLGKTVIYAINMRFLIL